MASIHELARKSLDERWIPIRDAKSLAEMEQFCMNTNCYFCFREDELQDLNEKTITCYDAGCPLSSRDKPDAGECCDGKFRSFFIALLTTEDFAVAKEAAADICKQLQALLDESDREW